MKNFRKTQLRMFGVLVPWLTANLGAIGQSKTAKQEAQDVIDAYPALLGKAGLTAVQTSDVTRRRAEQRKEFQRHIFTVLGPLRLRATRTNNVTMLGLVTLGRTGFKELAPPLQAGVGQEILAAAHAQAPYLADNGLDATWLAQADAAHAAFVAGLPDTQTLLDVRKNANATYEEVHTALMQQVYELDQAMAVFQTLNPTLLRDYKQARALLDVAGGQSASDEKPNH